MKKKIILGLSTILPIVSLPFMSASCQKTKETSQDVSSDDKKPTETHKVAPLNDGKAIAELDTRIFLKENNVKNRIAKAVVIDGADGDTVVVRLLESQGKFKEGEERKVRIATIDTPEKAVGGKIASDHEAAYAKRSSHFAETVLKNGKEVYLFITGEDTYERITADIFFNYEKDTLSSISEAFYSYAVEIVKAGLTLPMDHGGNNVTAMKYPSNLQHWTYYLIALSLKYARDNSKGFFADFTNAANPYAAMSKDIWIIKPLGEGWRPFVDYREKGEKFTSVYDYKEVGYQPIRVVYKDGTIVENPQEIPSVENPPHTSDLPSSSSGEGSDKVTADKNPALDSNNLLSEEVSAKNFKDLALFILENKEGYKKLIKDNNLEDDTKGIQFEELIENLETATKATIEALDQNAKAIPVEGSHGTIITAELIVQRLNGLKTAIEESKLDTE